MYQGSKARKNRPGKSMTISTSTQGSNSRSTSTTCSLNPELTSKRKSDSSFIPASPTEVYDTHELNNRDNEQPWTWDQPYRHDIPRAEDSDPWEICYELSKKYDDDLIGAWRDEVEHLLIFAGLFSAVVTAFAVESYKGLQSDPTESTIILLALIAAQLGANSTLIQPLSPTSGGSLPSPTTSLNVQLNVFHFLSLTLSISTVLIGILCLQWLREYDHDVGLPHKDSVGLRQMRFEGLLAWKVPNILSALPVILQLSLVLFFIGLLELLWSLDKVVAYLVTVVVGLTLLFLVITTVIPTFQYFFVHKSSLQVPQCPYKSPQSWAFHKLIRRIVWLASKSRPGFLTAAWRATRRRLRYVDSLKDENWAEYDNRWYSTRKNASPDSDTINALVWIEKTYAAPRVDVIQTIVHCMRDISHQAITKQVAVSSNVLDGLDPPAKRKDVAITFFLERHRNRHPELSVPHLESVIRAINSNSALIPYYRWPIHDISDLPSDVITQFLMSVKTLISSDRVLNSQDVGCIWDLIHIILSRQTVATNKEGPRWKRLSFDIMEQLQQFSSRLVTAYSVDSISKEIHSEHAHLRTDKLVPHSIHNIDPSGNSKDSNPSEIVIACAHGLIRVFPVLNQEELFSQFNVPTWKVNMVNNLNDCVTKLGGASKVFGPMVRKLWDKLLHQTLPPDVHLDVEGLNTPSQETVGASGNNGVPQTTH